MVMPLFYVCMNSHFTRYTRACMLFKLRVSGKQKIFFVLKGKEKVEEIDMNILIATDDNYVKYYRVTLTSLCENNQSAEIHTYVFYSHRLSASGIDDLMELERRYSIQFHFVYVDCFKDIEMERWSIETYYRILALELPETVNRILWLDGDVIINKSIEDFYYSDFGEAYFIACEDKGFSGGLNAGEYERLGFSKDQVYVNAGVLLMNLEGLRKNYTTKQFIDYIYTNLDMMKYNDQSFLNKFFQGKIKIEDELKYNCLVNAHYYKEEQDILEQACILHFAGGGQRPWNYEFRKHYASGVNGEIWWRYARKCGWEKEYRKWKVQNWIRVRPWQIAYDIYRLVIKKR